MEEWKRYRLGDICTIYGRIGFRGYTTEDLTSDPAEGAISLSPTNIVGGELDLSKPTYIKWDKYEESPEIMLHPNDVVIVKTGSSVGRTTLIRDVTHPLTLNPQLVVLKDIMINPVFLSYLVKSSRFQGLLKSITVGSAIPTLSQKNLANLPVDIPNESVQRKIADILNSLDKKILLNNRINHNLEEQAQALYKSWFVDFKPFKDGKFVDSELGMIPEGWRVGTIYDICDVYYGAPFNSILFNTEKKGLPLIRIRDLAKQEAGVFTEERHPKGQLTHKGDILVGMDGEFSIYIWGGEDSWINQRISRFSPKCGISSYFLIGSLGPQLKRVESSEVATTVIHIGKNDYDKFFALIPPPNVLKSFFRVSEPLFLQFVENISSNKVFSEARDALLPKLMSGNLAFLDLNS